MNKRSILLSILFFSLCTFHVAAQDVPTVRRNTPSGVEVSTFTEIPAATKHCDATVCDWWERLRIAANKLQKNPNGRSKSNFVNTFLEGIEKGFTIPVGDRPAQVLVPAPMPVTDKLPNAERNGTVKLLVELRADASIGEVIVTQKLGPGIDRLAVHASQSILFLPAIKDGSFVNEWQPQTYSFFHSPMTLSHAPTR